MSCPHLERTHRLADGELPADEADRARAHLATCEECQAELADLVQLDLAVAEAPRRAANVVPLAWYRRRITHLAMAAVAAAAVIAVILSRGHGPGTPPPPAIALAEKRVLEARLSWGPAASYRPYDVPRAAEQRHESIGMATLADVEKRGDLHGVGVLALLDGDHAHAVSYLDKAGDSPDVLADRAALALSEAHPEQALGLLDTALAKAPDHTAALWNRALALRDLGLSRAAADAFRRVAAHHEPGWSEEAAARATELDAQTDARRDRAVRVWGAMRTLASDGTGLTADDVRQLPGLSQLVLYDALRAAPTSARVAQLAPLFELLGPDAKATLARTTLRPALAATYARIIAGDPPTGPARERYLAALRAAHADELLIGTLIKLSPDGHTVRADELPELARLAAASPDPWYRLIGLEQEAAIAIDTDLPRAEQLLLRGRAICAQGSAPGYRCLKLDTLLAQVYREWQRLPEERAVLADAIARARRDNEWFIELQLLSEYIDVLVLDDDATSSGLPLIRAYAEELRLRSSDPRMCRAVVWTHVMTAMALINKLQFPAARRELAEGPACDLPLEPGAAAQQLFVRAHIVREFGTPDELAALRADIAKLRDDPRTTATVKIVLDHIEGRALIDRDPATAEPLLLRAIAAAKTAPPADTSAHKAGAWSYAVLAIAAARKGDGQRALALLAEEQGVELPDRCTLGVALDDQREIAVARDATGAVLVHYDEARTSTGLDPASFVPAEITAKLAACPVVDVLARPPIHGTPRLLPDAIAWRYRAARARPVGPAGDRELVIADVLPPPTLGLPRLASWGAAQGEQLTGPAATPDHVLAAIGDAGIATIHAHGLVDLGRADGSFLALSPDDRGRYALTASDVRAATFHTSPLVILAACRASQAAPVLHASWSLPVAFIHAGARAVIASASQIPDADAPAFFDEVRAAVKAGAPVAVAVRDARMHWLARHRGDWVRDVIVFE